MLISIGKKPRNKVNVIREREVRSLNPWYVHFRAKLCCKNLSVNMQKENDFHIAHFRLKCSHSNISQNSNFMSYHRGFDSLSPSDAITKPLLELLWSTWYSCINSLQDNIHSIDPYIVFENYKFRITASLPLSGYNELTKSHPWAVHRESMTSLDNNQSWQYTGPLDHLHADDRCKFTFYIHKHWNVNDFWHPCIRIPEVCLLVGMRTLLYRRVIFSTPPNIGAWGDWGRLIWWQPVCLNLLEKHLPNVNKLTYSISQEICTRFCWALLCCGYAIVHNEFTWSIYPYSSGLHCWHWGNR